jgi:hypothetical protein
MNNIPEFSEMTNSRLESYIDGKLVSARRKIVCKWDDRYEVAAYLSTADYIYAQGRLKPESSVVIGGYPAEGSEDGRNWVYPWASIRVTYRCEK